MIWYFSLAAGLVSLLPISDHAATRSDEPELSNRDQPAWTRVEPGEGTGCAFQTPFSFFYREVPASSKLLVYFQGGGACWEWVSCSGMFDSSVSADEVDGFRGIFDYDNPANPFRDYSVLFIPYCTGDVHVGDTIRHYGDPRTSRSVAHLGWRNVSAALEWLEPNWAGPFDYVTISGTSAGSYGALFYAPRIARMYPNATVSVIGDSGVPLLNDYPAILRGWGAPRVLNAIRQQSREADLTLEGAHVILSRLVPRAFVAQATSDRDGVQSGFYLISGSPNAREATYAILDFVTLAVPRFKSFIVSGGDHGLFVTDKFYSYTAGGELLVDWIRRAVAGQEVQTRRCSTCEKTAPGR